MFGSMETMHYGRSHGHSINTDHRLLTSLSLGGSQHAHRLASGTQHSIHAKPLWFTDIFGSLTKISFSLEGVP